MNSSDGGWWGTATCAVRPGGHEVAVAAIATVIKEVVIGLAVGRGGFGPAGGRD